MNRLLLLSLFIAMTPTMAVSQASRETGEPHAPEVAVSYNYIRSNAPPATCSCFSLNGGSLSVAKPVSSGKVAFAFDVASAHGTSIGSYGLTLSTFTAGVRYRPMPRAKWNPFGQVLAGATHASGTLVQGATPAATDPPLLIAGLIGGGIDRRLNPRWSIRLVEVNYLYTAVSNGLNDHQNNLRISAGLVYRFGKK